MVLRSDKMNVEEGRHVLVSSLLCFMLGRKNVIIIVLFVTCRSSSGRGNPQYKTEVLTTS